MLLLQVPDAADDLLAAAVLGQQPFAEHSEQAQVLTSLPELFPITVSVAGVLTLCDPLTAAQPALWHIRGSIGW